jgi:hypothetical protein
MFNYERHMQARDNRRKATEDRFLARLEKRTAAAEPLIGELCVEGKAVYYINTLTCDGLPTGQIKKGAYSDLVDYLMRNNYV